MTQLNKVLHDVKSFLEVFGVDYKPRLLVSYGFYCTQGLLHCKHSEISS